MKYLLDTSVCVGLLRNRPGPRSHLMATGPDAVAVSVLTEIELRVGAHLQRHIPDAVAVVDTLLTDVRVLELGRAVVDSAVSLKLALRRAGTPIGDTDVLIAATALAHGLTVVSSDRDFLRVAGLQVVTWAEPL